MIEMLFRLFVYSLLIHLAMPLNSWAATLAGAVNQHAVPMNDGDIKYGLKDINLYDEWPASVGCEVVNGSSLEVNSCAKQITIFSKNIGIRALVRDKKIFMIYAAMMGGIDEMQDTVNDDSFVKDFIDAFSKRVRLKPKFELVFSGNYFDLLMKSMGDKPFDVAVREQCSVSPQFFSLCSERVVSLQKNILREKLLMDCGRCIFRSVKYTWKNDHVAAVLTISQYIDHVHEKSYIEAMKPFEMMIMNHRLGLQFKSDRDQGSGGTKPSPKRNLGDF